MIRSLATLAILAATPHLAAAQGVWPDDPWTDTRPVPASPEVSGLGRAVAIVGSSLFTSGRTPTTNEGAIAVFEAMPGGFAPRAIIHDPAPTPTPGFGYPIVTDSNRMYVADAGYYTVDHPVHIVNLDPQDGPEGPGRVEVFRFNIGGGVTHLETLSDPSGHERSGFGSVIASSSSYLAVSAPNLSVLGVRNVGAVFVYRHNGFGFILQSIITPPTLAQDGYFGYATAFDGSDTLLVGWPGFNGASGRVFRYGRVGAPEGWDLEQIFSPTDPAFSGAAQLRYFGASIATAAFAPGLVAIAAPRSSVPGHATRDFVAILQNDEFSDERYPLQTIIEQPIQQGGANFGRGMSLSVFDFRPALIIGSGDRSSGGGAVNIYSRNNLTNEWSRDAALRFMNGGSVSSPPTTETPRFFVSGNDREEAILVSRDALCFRDLRGDANNDGLTDFADLNLVLSSFGQSGDDLPADLNNDGVVDFIDLNFVLFTFGSPCLPPN